MGFGRMNFVELLVLLKDYLFFLFSRLLEGKSYSHNVMICLVSIILLAFSKDLL